jgi:hypothetical protein
MLQCELRSLCVRARRVHHFHKSALVISSPLTHDKSDACIDNDVGSFSKQLEKISSSIPNWRGDCKLLRDREHKATNNINGTIERKDTQQNAIPPPFVHHCRPSHIFTPRLSPHHPRSKQARRLHTQRRLDHS